jgi:hypothetical protein
MKPDIMKRTIFGVYFAYNERSEIFVLKEAMIFSLVYLFRAKNHYDVEALKSIYFLQKKIHITASSIIK